MQTALPITRLPKVSKQKPFDKGDFVRVAQKVRMAFEEEQRKLEQEQRKYHNSGSC